MNINEYSLPTFTTLFIGPLLHDYQNISSLDPLDDSESHSLDSVEYDYTYAHSPARIALYDDLRSAPRIINIDPAPTNEYIEALASKTYEQAKLVGGMIPYTVIREVSENFIHAQFSEIVVSILNEGNTIRFSDQGPGINQKDAAQNPGFTSAIEPMKKYIRGVGSGLPIVKDYLSFSNGTITIEDNLTSGAVVTISLVDEQKQQEEVSSSSLTPPLNKREKEFLKLFSQEGALGVTDLSQLTGVPQSSTYVVLTHLEEYGLIEKTVGQKRILTDLGFSLSRSL